MLRLWSRRTILRDNILGITEPTIRRLARRGGVKRIFSLLYEETRGEGNHHTGRDFDVHGNAKCKTVTALDALKSEKKGSREQRRTERTLTAERLLLPGELAKHAVSKGTKKVTKYTSSK